MSMSDSDRESPGSGPEAPPDVRFSLGGEQVRRDPDEQAEELTRRIARELAAMAPQGWIRLDAVFALTVAEEAAELVYTDGERAVRALPADSTVRHVRELRRLSARTAEGPWLRLVLELTSAGDLDIYYDHGDRPFPPGQLFPVEAYRADLEAFPRASLPTWLAAYLRHGERQVRTPRLAAAAPTGQAGTTDLLPPLPILWARWAMLAAADAAVGAAHGSRIAPSVGVYEDGDRNGATLWLLSGGRAVLSGGRADSPRLAAAYNGVADLPDLYLGAPGWVTSQVVNPRAATGLLSFCYWWQAGRWCISESPKPDDDNVALPDIWTEDAVVDQVIELIRGTGHTIGAEELRVAAETVIGSAESGLVTREILATLFADPERFDVDAAFVQFDAAGLAAVLLTPLPAEEAVALVRDYILERRLETPGYPVSGLVAERVSVGWIVHVPPPEGQVMLGRAVFYVADDAVLERSSSSIAPSAYLPGFEQRFQQRLGAVG
ncbi:hypothetical protein [Nocardia asiatica]|uniref:hypothetical protein n=1 Tax=Nocardia asiatica TaxID=209252 RepID=UPI003EDEF80B